MNRKETLPIPLVPQRFLEIWHVTKYSIELLQVHDGDESDWLQDRQVWY